MRGTILLILTVLNYCLCAQDSLVRVDDISYSSDFEKSLFEQYFKNRIDNYLPLFLTLDDRQNETKARNINEKVDKLIKEIEATELSEKKPQKQIKSVYQIVHDSFLRKYELENRFHEIFETGKYNCLTATALYALVFEQIEIPYSIKEEPTHVYLVAYPDQSNILVETTTPASGFMNFDQIYKNAFVSNLRDQKIIGKEEYESYSTEQLFNKYYFSQENIDLQKLVGLHYLNDAIYLQYAKEYKKSFEQAEKGYLFYPSQRSQYLLASFGAELVSKTDLDPLEKSKLVVKLSRHRKMGITPDMIKAEFEGITYEVLIKQNDKQLFNQCYQVFVDGIEDEALINEISYFYYYENGRIYFNQGNFEKARNYFKKSLELQPNNVDLGLIFSQCLSHAMKSQQSSTAILDTMKLYKEEFPSLMEIQNFKSMMATAYILEFQSRYSKGQTNEGDINQHLFEELMDNDDIIIHPDIVGLAYSTASTYYFKKGQKTKAKEYIEKGLKYAPGNYELRARMQMLSR